MMQTSEHEGLGLSVLVYLGAIIGALALFAVPVYYAARGEVHENPKLAQSDPLLNGTVIVDRLATRFPLERLQKQTLAEADPVVTTPKPAKKEPKVAAARPRRDGGTPVAELQPQRTRQAMFPFSLF
jgi:hypothetical protein